MPAPALLMWIDFESSGLLVDPVPPTLLEGAWCVTDTHGAQRTPLSQAFCALPTSRTTQMYAPTPIDFGYGLTTPTLVNGPDNQPEGGWHDSDYPSDAVREMHQGNGLTLEWASFEAGPDRGRILRHWSEVERLLLDALDMAGWRNLDRGQVLLAGGGVSHYEDRFLRTYCPRVFDDPRVHYSTGVDEEGVFPGTADRLIERYRPEMYSTDTDTRWANIDLDPRRYDAADRCGWTRRRDLHTGGVVEEVTEHWAVTEKDPHRAAPGIARALMAYRLLPRLFAESFYTFGSG